MSTSCFSCKPRYSTDGSTQKEIEESMMDYFQNFLNSLEDNEDKVSGYCEPVSWNYGDTEGGADLSAEQTDEKFQTAEITIPGILGWLLGQQRGSTNGDPLTIYVNFDHEDNERNCGRELTLPVSHMKDEESFQQIFITTLFIGQAFSRP